MDKKKLMLLLGAMVIAVGTALAARSILSGASTAPVQAAVAPTPKGPKVLVAQRALPVGTILSLDAVSFQPWPKDLVQDAYFIDGNVDKKKLLGTVVRYPITAGQPLTQGALVAPGDRGFLAAALGAGMRAVSIPVSANTGVAGFIFPGDHVDLMLTQTVKRSGLGGDADSLKTTETVLKNIRVLATDQSTESEVINGKTTVRTSNIVTIEVTPRIAEKVQVAQTLGTLSLALRSIADNQSDLEHAIASGSVKVPDGASKQEEERLLAKASHRPTEGATSFSTGGDVSRFSRKTLPPALPTTPGGAAEGLGPVVKIIRGSAETSVPVGGASNRVGLSPARAGGQ